MAVANAIHDSAEGERLNARAGSEVVGNDHAAIDAHARTAFRAALRLFFADFGRRLLRLSNTPLTRRLADVRSVVMPFACPNS